jgi:hypothetical protein
MFVNLELCDAAAKLGIEKNRQLQIEVWSRVLKKLREHETDHKLVLQPTKFAIK